jgi:two-component system, OmpR family, sensor histidine kinase KdpD
MGRSRSFATVNLQPPPARWGIVGMLAVVAVGTLLVYPLKEIAPVVSLGVIYLPGVLLVSTFWGWRIGLFTAVLSTIAFNWFHIPPTGRLAIAADRDGVALVVFAIVAIASSALAEVARARAAEAERRREETDRVLAELRSISAERDRMEAEAFTTCVGGSASDVPGGNVDFAEVDDLGSPFSGGGAADQRRVSVDCAHFGRSGLTPKRTVAKLRTEM